MRTRKETRQSTPLAYVERVNRAIDHVVSHLAEPLSLNAIARAAHISPFHFHRVFQALVGETPTEFVKRLRLDRALLMMSHGRKRSLTTIASTCGFASSSDFSRCFKQKYGVPPSRFDIHAWRCAHKSTLERLVSDSTGNPYLEELPEASNPDRFEVRIRTVPARTVAYIRVADPYAGSAVPAAAARLVQWAERHNFADGQWLGYQWENPELVPLEQCRYHIAVVADRFVPAGEVGRFKFPKIVVAEVQLRGGIDLELRALQWLYGTWLPRSGYMPDDHPGFEAFKGRPFAHGLEYFEFSIQLPIRKG